VSELRPIEPVTKRLCVVALGDAEFRGRIASGGQALDELRVQSRVQRRELIRLQVVKEDSGIGWGNVENPTARPRPHTSRLTAAFGAEYQPELLTGRSYFTE
jgi:hypothetical protein